MERKRFRQVHLEITTLCNLTCPFCPKTGRQPHRISESQFRSRLDQVVPLTDLVYLHLMGEPLSHPSLSAFFSIAEELSAPIGITTNGTLLTNSIDLLSSPSLRQLNISFHAFTSYEKAYEAASAAREIGQKNPNLHINLRLWMSGEHHDFSTDLSAQALKNLFQFENSLLDQHETGRRSSRNIGGRIYLHFDRPFSWPGSAEPKSTGTCHALHAQFGILTDGSVVPCCLDSEGEIVLGNIDDTPIETVLASPRARSMRGGFSRGVMVESLCQRCGYAQDRFANKKQVKKS